MLAVVVVDIAVVTIAWSASRIHPIRLASSAAQKKEQETKHHPHALHEMQTHTAACSC